MSAPSEYDVVVVGASLGAVQVADNLRRAGHTGTIHLIGDEPWLPYDRPPLSKAALAESESLGRLPLKAMEWYTEAGITLSLGGSATRIDPHTHIVEVDGAEPVRGDKIIIATGSRPRALPGIAVDQHTVFTLRSRDDSDALRQRLASPGHLVVVGGGFIGLEATAAALNHGWSVSVVERDAAVLQRVLPAELAAMCWAPFEESTLVDLRVQSAVVSVDHRGQRVEVGTSSGETLTGDAVLVAAGGVPNTEWLTDSGIAVEDGILCSDTGRTSHPGIWAVGDVSNWPNAWLGRRGRVEQWQATCEQAVVVAADVAGRPAQPWSEPPYFWSDLPGGRVQFLGEYGAGMTVHLLSAKGRPLALVEDRGMLRGVCARSLPRVIARARPRLLERTSIDDALAWVCQEFGATSPASRASGPLAAASPIPESGSRRSATTRGDNPWSC